MRSDERETATLQHGALIRKLLRMPPFTYLLARPRSLLVKFRGVLTSTEDVVGIRRPSSPGPLAADRSSPARAISTHRLQSKAQLSTSNAATNAAQAG